MTIGFIGIGNIAAALVEGFCTPGEAALPVGAGAVGAASMAAESRDLELFLSPRNEAR